MKTSAFFVVAGAALALAGPINKRAMETDWVVEMVTVTVTEGSQPSHTASLQDNITKAPKPIVAPPPAPTTTKEAPPPPVLNPVEPTTKHPVPTTKKPEPTQAPAPSQPAPQPQPSSPPTSGSYADAVVAQHNVHRRNHTASDLTWDADLAASAKIVSDTCVFEHKMNVLDQSYGQNLAMFGSSDASATDEATLAHWAKVGISSQWYYGEVKQFTKYGVPDPTPFGFENWGHFTALVWKRTEKVGCHTTYCGSNTGLASRMGAYMTTCNYFPAGNFSPYYNTNVTAPLDQPTVTV